MASSNHQDGRAADPAQFRLSSLDEDKRPTSKLLEQTDEEAGHPENAASPVQAQAQPVGSGNLMMVIWIAVNTFATIGIVSHHHPAKRQIC